MTTILCDLCQKPITRAELFILTLKGVTNLTDQPLFTLDVCAQCTNKIKPDAPQFIETIAAAGKSRSPNRGHKGA